jgi:hypothetical protein
MGGVGQSPHFGRGVGGSAGGVHSGSPPILGVGEDLWVLLVSLSQPRGQCTPGTGSW